MIAASTPSATHQGCIIFVSTAEAVAMKLVPASWDLVPQILEILKKHGDDSKTSHNELDGRNTWRRHPDCPEMFLLTPDGKVDEYGTFVHIIPKLRYDVHVHTLSPNLAELADALLSNPHIDWKRSPMISCLHERLNPLLDLLEVGLPHSKRDPVNVLSFHIQREAALNLAISVPNDVNLTNLTLEHAELVNSLWPHGKTAESLQEIITFLKFRPSWGLFKKDTGELVSWCLYGEYGGPGQLQTVEKHKKKGYGEVVLRAITKSAAELGVDPHAFIVLNNVASMNLFKKVGYESRYAASWTAFLYEQTL